MRIPNPLAGQPGVPFSGWRVVLLGVLANALGTGLLGFYGFMVSPLIDEFGATPNQLGLGMSIAIFAMSVLGPLLGPLYDRGQLRALMLAGVAAMLAGMLLMSRATTLWQLGLFLALASIGMSMYGFLPVKVMIVNWFVRKRGTALALAYSGTSLAGFAVPVIAALLIDAVGWRGALIWTGCSAALVAAPAVAVLAVRRPEDVGQYPDGVASGLRPTEPAVSAGVALRTLVRNANFWRIGVGDALAMCVPVASGLFFVRHMEELGIARTQAAMVLTLMSGFSMVGKLSVGVLADRFDARLLAVSTLALHVLGLSLLATGDGLAPMLAAAIPLGLGGGGFLPLPSILQGACFGRAVIGQVSGLHGFLGLPLLLTGAPLVGVAASYTGSFVVPFLALAVIQTAAAILLATVKVPAVEPATLAEAA